MSTKTAEAYAPADSPRAPIPLGEVPDWTAWSTKVGMAALPVLQSIEESLPSVQAAMLCTTDGLNLCALGVDESEIGHVAALTSTMMAVTTAHSTALGSGDFSDLHTVNMSHGSSHTVVTSIEFAQTGSLLLAVCAMDTSLGVMLVSVRKAVQDLTTSLADQPSIDVAS